MSYTALYREWRPKVFEELLGQEHIVKTIKNQIIGNKVPHAYLFCGTRGTGKTSTAKILSKAVNCLDLKDGDPCNKCENCLAINDGILMDVVEIDAASNTGVDNVRELIEDVKYPPQRGKKKVYIIDEVHMLSIQAFNALLKTIEEPPSYVIFILATTDPQKVPATILSRCQRFDFKRIPLKSIEDRLRIISKDKGIYVEDKSLELIARVSDGAMRDALSILDQSMSIKEGKIEYDDVVNMLGLTSNEDIFSLIDAMCDHDVDRAIKLVDEVIMKGKDVFLFIKDLSKHFRNLLMVKVSKSPQEVVDASLEAIGLLREQAAKLRSEEILRGINILLDAENQAKGTTLPRIILEMAIIKFCRIEYDTSAETMLLRLNNLEEALKEGKLEVKCIKDKETIIKKSSTKEIKGNKAKDTEDNANEKNESVNKDEFLDKKHDSCDGTVEVKGIPSAVSIDNVLSSWKDVIEIVKTSKVTAASLLDLGKAVEVKGNLVVIGFEERYSFCKAKLDSPEDKKIIEGAFGKVLKAPLRVSFIIADKKADLDKSIEKTIELLGEDVPINIIDGQ